MSEEEKNKTRDDITEAIRMFFLGMTGKWKIRGTQTVLRYFVLAASLTSARRCGLYCVFLQRVASLYWNLEWVMGESH